MDYRLSLLLAALSFGAAASAEKINITIYFESLCQDSQRFFMEQFDKGYKALKDEVNFDFVPYGHANSTSCQHGPRECEGNKILDCGVNKINETAELVGFVECIMHNYTTDADLHFNSSQCNKTTKQFDNIITCAEGTEGDQYFSDFGVRTENAFKNLTVFDVPFITINNEVNATVSKNLRKDFLGNFCSSPKGKNLKGCPSSSTTLAASVILTLLALVMGRL